MKKFILLTVLLVFVGCSKYGDKVVFNNTEIYYTHKELENYAKKLGEYLLKTGFADGKKKSLQLDIKKDVYIVKMVIAPESQNADWLKEGLIEFSKELMQNVFDGKMVVAIATDENFKILKIQDK
ncbi:MAG: hypothetical protein ACP5P3_07560 [Ignavibacteria bacterium]